MRNTQKQALLGHLLVENAMANTGWHKVCNDVLLEGMTMKELQNWNMKSVGDKILLPSELDAPTEWAIIVSVDIKSRTYMVYLTDCEEKIQFEVDHMGKVTEPFDA